MDRATRRTRRLAIALGVNVALVVAQVVAGVVAHSTGLVADAGHNVTDVAGLAMSLVAVRWALRPRSPSRSFGYHRGTILAALANAAIIAAVTVAIGVAGIERLVHPHAVRGAVVVAVAGVLILLDAQLRWADPVASLAVGALIIVEAYRLLRSSLEVLLESAPADVDLDALTGAMGTVAGVAEVHDLHVWSLSSEVRALSAHVVVSGHPSLEQAQAIGDRVRDAVAGPFTIAHTTLELECERCTDDDADPCLMDSLTGHGTVIPR